MTMDFVLKKEAKKEKATDGVAFVLFDIKKVL